MPRRLRRPGQRGRNNGKGRGIARLLRQWIVTGRFKPGDRLPPRRQLQQRFRTAAVTLHRAIEELQAEGFLESQSTRGTVVADPLPFHNSYALVLPQIVAPRMEGPLALFNRDLYLEADRMRREGAVGFRIYQAVRRERDEGQIQAAVRAVEHHLVTGLILAVPWTAEHSVLQKAWQAAGVPVVGLASPELSPAGIACVVADADRWFDRALSRLAEQGCRRVAVLSAANRQLVESLAQRMAGFGLETASYWMQFVDPNMAWAARHVAQLLMRGHDRPDALLILDDSLVEPAIVGLREMGVDTTRDLYVVGHCNYPQVTPTALPIERLGFDVPQVLSRCMDVLNQARAGQTPPPVTRIEPIFQKDEYEQAPGRAAVTRTCAQNGTSAPI